MSREDIQKYAREFIGTFAPVFLAAGAAIIGVLTGAVACRFTQGTAAS